MDPTVAPAALHHHRRSHIAALATAVLLAVLSATLVASSPSGATTTPELDPVVAASDLEVEVLAAINVDRTAAGLPAVTPVGDLSRVAREHSARMADGTDLHHNSDLGDDIRHWRRVGENVGRSPSVDAVHAAFMASPSHAANILDPGFTEIGIAVDERADALWVTQVFREPSAPTILPF